jgi:hypothetical protein
MKLASGMIDPVARSSLLEQRLEASRLAAAPIRAKTYLRGRARRPVYWLVVFAASLFTCPSFLHADGP